MKGVFVQSKPNIKSKDFVVVDVNVAKPGCCSEYAGLNIWVDPHYSILLKQHMTEEQFQEFSSEINEAFLAAKVPIKGGKLGAALKVLGMILACPLLCLCVASGGGTMISACEKSSQDKKTDKALGKAHQICEKWNEQFALEDNPVSIRVQCLRRSLRMTRDDIEDYAEVNDEIWIEIELGTIEKKKKKKKKKKVPKAKKGSKKKITPVAPDSSGEEHSNSSAEPEQ